VSQITLEGAGRRERNKQRTRGALIQAAMELFEAKGYEHTAVREITDAVDVSERTFFRYFASKEDLVMSFVQDEIAAFAQALAARPAQEEPFTAIRNAHHDSLPRLGSTLSVVKLIDSTPSLLAAHLRYTHEHGEEIVRVLAEREGIDPATDLRPRVLAGVFGTVVFLASRDWRAGDDQSLDVMTAAFDAYADQVMPALSGHWARPLSSYLRKGGGTTAVGLVHGAHAELNVVFRNVERHRGDTPDINGAGPAG
jgi:AcrR family transcriptional regulator